MNAFLQALVAAAALGSFMPPLVAVVVRSHWPAQAKAVVALVTSVVVGTAGALSAGQFTGLTWITSVAVAVGATQMAYLKYWKATGIAPWIETRILPGSPQG